MPLFEDTLSGKVAAVVAVSAAALALPRLFPRLAPPVRAAIKNGAALFLEAEFEAEGGLIDKLVSETLQALLDEASKARTPEERKRSAQRAIHGFERRARARAQHWGGDDEADRSRRYRRHVAHLRRAVAKAECQSEQERTLLAEVAEGVPEVW
ncbi:MAG TPA: hypothetical protein VJ779_10895 [Acetobacteraceae bacterium]|nr:hypothetical protein [Acetobacteraceae bacterium]